MGEPALVLLAADRRWVVAFHWLAQTHGVPLREARDTDECHQLLAANPGSVVAVALEQGREPEAWAWWESLDASMDVPWIVLADRGTDETAWLLREAGAMHVTMAHWNLEPVVKQIACWLDQARSREPQQHTSYRQQVWDRLPWSDDFAVELHGDENE